MSDDPFATAATIYRSMGWVGTLPLPYAKKTPPPTGFTGETGRWPESTEVIGWRDFGGPKNIALRLPPNVIALDVDDLKAFANLVELVGPLPATWRAHSGGERVGHFYYRLPAGVVSTGWGAPCPGVDLLRFGHRYSIVAPSLHPSGTRYAWARPDGTESGTDLPGPGDLPELPAAWVDYLSGESDESVASAPSKPQRDDFGPITHNHDDTLSAYAAHVVGLYPGITLDHAVDLVVARGQDCVPSWASGMRPGDKTLEAAAREDWVPSALRKFGREPDPIWPAYEAALAADLSGPEPVQRSAAVEKEAERLRVAAEARAIVEAERSPAMAEESVASRMVEGGAFVLDIPDGIPSIWGEGQGVLWAKGESLIIAGPPGVGKTTIAHQVVEALITGGSVLGLPVVPADRRVLYLACDRPAQIARALARRLSKYDRAILNEKLVVWKGPPPGDFARDPELLTRMCRAANAGSVIVDSLKDVAVGLSEDIVGAGLNLSRQTALAAGIEVMELHHVVKRGENGSAPTRLADLYGSAWISAGAGSVVLIWGEAGDTDVRLSHLKQPGAPVGPLAITHDHEAGFSSVRSLRRVEDMADLFVGGMTAKAAALELFGDTNASSVEKARRKCESAVSSGALVRSPDAGPGRGKEARYVSRCSSLSGALDRCPLESGHGGQCAAWKVTEEVTRVS